jgi:hypothetical protein
MPLANTRDATPSISTITLEIDNISQAFAALSSPTRIETLISSLLSENGPVNSLQHA